MRRVRHTREGLLRHGPDVRLWTAGHLEVAAGFGSADEVHDGVVAEDDEKGADGAGDDAADEGGLVEGHCFGFLGC